MGSDETQEAAADGRAAEEAAGRAAVRSAGRRSRTPARHAARVARWGLGSVLTLAVVLSALALVVWLRLQQGPVQIPLLASLVEQQVNEATDRVSLSVEGLEFALGNRERPSRLEFTGLTVADGEGRPLLAVPRIWARFAIGDLVEGRVQPSEIELVGASARIVRTSEGRIRLALTDDEPVTTDAGGKGRLGRSMDTVETIVDGFVGDGPEITELRRLQRVTITDANLSYVNAATGRTWRSDGAELELTKTDDGARLDIRLTIEGHAPGEGPTLQISAERQRGTQVTQLSGVFDRVRPRELAAEVPELGWLDAIDAPLAGRLDAKVTNAGAVETLAGSLVAAGGAVLAEEDGKGVPFDRFAVAFSYEPGLNRMRVGSLELTSDRADLSMSGFADLAQDSDGSVTGLAAQLDIAKLDLDIPDLFADPQSFERGRAIARLDLKTLNVEVAEARLEQGPLRVAVSGRAWPDEDAGWIGEMRIAGETIAVDRLVALWPLRAAKGARRWLGEHLLGGTVDDVLAHLRLGDGPPELNLDFTFRELASTYLDDMTPVEGAAGRGHLTWERMDLEIDDAWVEPLPGKRIMLGGSTIAVTDIFESDPPATITIRGRGPTDAVLALLDQEPLGFVSKLDLDPETVRGTAVLSTVLVVPLDSDVKLTDVSADAEATLSDVRLPFTLDLTGTMAIAADRLSLVANTERMRLEGRVTSDGTPLGLDWEERYGGGVRGRDIRLTGTATPALLKRINLEIPGFDGGTAPLTATITQAKGQPSSFTVDANLTDAALTVEPVFWSKAPGGRARVKASGRFGRGPTVIEQLALDGPGLAARGSLTLYPDAGGIQSARITALDMGRLADAAAIVTARGPGSAGFDVEIEARHADIALFERAGPPSPPPVIPVNVSYTVGKAVLTEGIALEGVEGTFTRSGDGVMAADLTGRVNGLEPVQVTYAKDPGVPGTAGVTAPDAGATLQAAGLFEGAKGGTLTAKATIAPDARTTLSGTAVIRDMIVRQGEEQTFARVLRQGDLPNEADVTRSTGLSFERIEVPFSVRGSRVTINTALATSPALAIKAAGQVNVATQRVTLRGVISPAYALTGFLSNIPVIGTLLGGEGEGVLAMTFAVDGPTADPSVTVNPLSLLAPGFLRNVFEGDGIAGAGAPKTAAERIADAEARTERAARTAAEKEAADAQQAERLRILLESDY